MEDINFIKLEDIVESHHYSQLKFCFSWYDAELLLRPGALCGNTELKGLVERLGGVVHPDKSEHEAQHDDEDVEAHCLPGHHLAAKSQWNHDQLNISDLKFTGDKDGRHMARRMRGDTQWSCQ